MLCGLICSGKTTLAKKIERENKAVIFSPDDWMIKLFGPNHSELDGLKYAPRVAELIRMTYTRLLELNIDIVLDDGFQKRASRDEVRSYAEKLGVNHKLYFLNYPEHVLLQRLSQRNTNNKDNQLIIPKSNFHIVKKLFEPPKKEEELFELINENT